MNEKRIESLVKILKTTLRELEDEIQPDPFTYPSVDTTEEESKFKVDYSDVLTYYAADYDGNHPWD